MSDNKPPEVKDLTIPKDALARCPIRKFEYVGIDAFCARCDLCGGLLDVTNGAPGEMKFADRYRVKCNAPRVLEILEVNLENRE